MNRLFKKILSGASGPGGQNVNKVSTARQLRFDIRNSALPDPVRQRLEQLAGKRLTDEGALILEARRFRSQERNREDALQRLLALIRQATQPASAASQNQAAPWR